MLRPLHSLAGCLMTVEDVSASAAPGGSPAGVLVPLFESASSPGAIFTQRQAHLRRHAGEISFPGGRREPGDRTILETALRETLEEIGLPRERITVVGGLPPIMTLVTGYSVFPFVGIVEPLRPWTANPAEVERVIELRLDRLRASFANRQIERYGVRFDADTYEVDGHVIWGATARILTSLLELLDHGPDGF